MTSSYKYGKINSNVLRTLSNKSSISSLIMKGIPLAYNKDMQEDKELSFDAMDTAKGCIALFNGMLKTMKLFYHILLPKFF